MIHKFISIKLGIAILLLVIAILVPLSYSIHQFFVHFYTEQTISSLVTHGQYVEQMIRDKEDPLVQQAAKFNVMGSELVIIDGDGEMMMNTVCPSLESLLP
jgi:predicted  nucleic acid-binding Zn ribbon protein